MDLQTISVIIPTYRRPQLAARVLRQLDSQSLPPSQYEVIVVDDGSPEPVAGKLQAVETRYRLTVLSQKNGGAGAARQTGVRAAQNELLVFLDDDMEVGPGFLEEHARAHQDRPHAVVQGRIDSGPDVDRRPLFERYHARRMEQAWAAYAAGKRMRGQNLCTGNVSVPRADFLESGGFDVTLKHSEDAELGLRLEKAGAQILFATRARSVHGPDHESLEGWLGRALRYGASELAVGRKHAWAAHADPFRYLFVLDPARASLIAASALWPRATAFLPAALARAGAALDLARLRTPAVHATGLAYSTQVYRGLGEELGSSRAFAAALLEFLAKAGRDPASVENVPRLLSAAARAREDFRLDVEARHRGEAKYAPPGGRPHIAPEIVESIGMQIVLGYRVMRAFRDARMLLAARIVSRLMRHLYSCDVHWEAEIAPGLSIAHGMGLAIAGGVRIGPRCILSHQVSLGIGAATDTRERGVPTLEEDVHVGPGAVITGPVTIGAGTKVMPGAVITFSVPPRSIVETPRPAILRRGPPAEAPRQPAQA